MKTIEELKNAEDKLSIFLDIEHSDRQRRSRVLTRFREISRDFNIRPRTFAHSSQKIALNEVFENNNISFQKGKQK